MHIFRNRNGRPDQRNNFTAQDPLDHLFLTLGMVVGFMILYGIQKKINVSHLPYYISLVDDTPKGIIYLTLGTQVNPIDGSEQQHEFTVTPTPEGRTYTLKAEDEQSRLEWIDKINKVIYSSNSLAKRGGAVCMNRRMTMRPRQSQASLHTKRRYKYHPRKRTRTSTGHHHATTTKAPTGHRRRAGGTQRRGARPHGGRRRSRGR